MWSRAPIATAPNRIDLRFNGMQLHRDHSKIKRLRRSEPMSALRSHRRGHWFDPSIATKTIRIFGLSERLLTGQRISAGLRAEAGAHQFASIRSYLQAAGHKATTR
jgi:hypothetical protein